MPAPLGPGLPALAPSIYTSNNKDHSQLVCTDNS
jgi:hypothetical protein